MTAGVSMVLLLAGGCATTSKKDLTADTNEKVSQLVDQMGALNKTALDLQAKQDSNDENIRKVQSNMEEMQARIDRVNRDVKSVQKIVYQQNNLTPPGGADKQPVVEVEPPAGSPAPTSVSSAATPATAEPAPLESLSKPERTTTYSGSLRRP